MNEQYFLLDKFISYMDNWHVKEFSHMKSDQSYPNTDAISAYATLRRTHDALHRYVSRKLAEWGLSVPKYGVIKQLYDRGSIPLSEIGSLIFRCNSNMTTLIDRMEEDGLVEKIGHDGDRRVKNIRLTAKGQKLAPKVIADYRKFLHEMMSKNLSRNEHKVLADLLNRAKAGVEGGTRDKKNR